MKNQQSETNENRPMSEVPLWRSLLYMPADNEKFLAKAQSRGADAIILDLEDSVAPEDKLKAREICKSAIQKLVDGPSDVLVRINAPIGLAVRDIEAVTQQGLRGLLLPKVESAGILVAMDELLTSLEQERGMSTGQIKTIPMLETPKGTTKTTYFQTLQNPTIRAIFRLFGSVLRRLICVLEITLQSTLLGTQEQ